MIQSYVYISCLSTQVELKIDGVLVLFHFIYQLLNSFASVLVEACVKEQVGNLIERVVQETTLKDEITKVMELKELRHFQGTLDQQHLIRDQYK